jgi:hypothetical protein
LSRPLGLALLFGAAALFSALTIRHGIQPNDEGLMLQAAARIADGQLPYSDFWWFYPPGQPYLLAGLWDVFGPSLIWWRVVRVAVNALVVVLVYVLARRAAPRGLSLVAAAVACGAMAFPSGAHPFPIALAFALGALLLIERPVAAGVLVGFCAAWRIEFAAYVGLALVVAYALSPRSWPRRFAAMRGVVLAALAVAVVLYAPVVLSAGLSDSWRLLVDYPLTDFSQYQSLPFPLDYDGLLNTSGVGGFLSDSSESILHFYLPLALVIGLAGSLLALGLGWSRERWWQVAPAVFTIGMAHYLVVRPDIFHTAPLAVMLAVLGAWALARVGVWPKRQPGVDKSATPPSEGAGFPVQRSLAGLGALAAALALAYSLVEGTDRFVHGLVDDTVALDVPIADGVRDDPRRAVPLAQAVAHVRARVPAGRPIYVMTKRADLVTSGYPLFYVLAERPNPTRYDIAAPGVVTSAPVQDEIVRDLERAGYPLVVRWTDELSAAPEPNAAGKSSGVRILDDFLNSAYRETNRFGDFHILERK